LPVLYVTGRDFRQTPLAPTLHKPSPPEVLAAQARALIARLD